MTVLKLEQIALSGNNDIYNKITSYKEALEMLNNVDALTSAFIIDSELNDKLNTFLYHARRELFNKMSDELMIRSLRSYEAVPKGSIFIDCDMSNMYANYNYYYNEKDNMIYEERCSLGD